VARLFTCGFEENNFIETMWFQANGAVSFVTSPVHSGTYALRTNPTASSGNVRKDIPTQITTGSAFLRTYFRLGAIPASDTNRVIRLLNSSVAVTQHVRQLSSGKLQLWNDVSSGSATSTTVLSIDTWYRLQLRVLLSDTVGVVELKIFLEDATTALETLTVNGGVDTLNVGIKSFLLGPSAGSTADFFFDDVAFNDDSGSFQNTMPGPAKVFLLEPSGDNTVTWTIDGGTPAATRWEGVDDLPGAPDDGDTYNSSTTNQTDKLDLSNLGAEVTSDADIILVDVYGRQGSDGTAGTRVIDFELWDEADSQSSQMSISADINGWRICDTDEHLVFDAGSRTKANIDSFRVGYSRSIGGSNEIRITAQWVNVEWIEMAAAAGQPYYIRDSYTMPDFLGNQQG
jgi:hypothetical protein